MVVSVPSAMVSRFCVRPTSKRWVLRIIQVTMKHDPFNAYMVPCRHPCRLYIHLGFTYSLVPQA